MKKFISVLLAIMMVVAVMPFAVFAAGVDVEKLYHPCYPREFTDMDMSKADCFVTAWDDEGKVTEVTDKFMYEYISDGKANTGTYLPVAKETRLRFSFGYVQEFGQIVVTVNGKGNLNPGEESDGLVSKATDFDFTVKVVVKTELGGDVLYVSEPQSAKGKTELVFDVNSQGRSFDVIITDAAGSTSIPRIWEVDAKEMKYDLELVHNLVEVVTQKSTTVTHGKAHLACTRCDYTEAEYDLPLLGLDELSGGGVLGLDDVTITEELGVFDEDGNPIKDIDGNTLGIETHPDSKAVNLFDGVKNSGGLWSGNSAHSFWTAATGGKLVVEFEPTIVSYVNITFCVNAWPCISFKFYNGDELVGSAYGNWGHGEDSAPLGNIDDRWTYAGDTTIDFADWCGFKGETIDKIEITMENVHATAPNYRKLSEIEIGTHGHVYTTEQALAGVNGGEEDPCKWTYTGTCIECEHVTEGLVAYVHDLETKVVKEPTCGDGISSDKCKREGCGYESGEYAVPGTGAHDFTATVVQNKYATCGAQGTSTFVCSTCMTKETASVEALVGKKLNADLVGVFGKVASKGTALTADIIALAAQKGCLTFPIAATDAQSGAALTVNYNLAVDFATGELSVASVGAAPAGYHTFGWKVVVPSTYTVHGVDGGYCTVCGEEFKDTYREAELLDPKEVRIMDLGFSKRVADFNGIRATYKINRESVKVLTNAGYSVRVWIVATNEAGESKEIQVFGVGSKAWMDVAGRTSVVIKGVDADEVITFTAKISVMDSEGEQIVYRDLGATSYNEIA